MARSTIVVAGLFVMLALCCTMAAGYRCQETMNAYFQIMTAHNFSMLPSILNESIVWTIPGGQGVLPFNGVYKGPDAVVQWAETIFAAIHMYHDGEYGEVNTDFQGHISLHDESIVVRRNGRYYRAAVAHEWHFDDQCKVTIFNGYYDTMAAVIAYYDGIAYPYPIPATGAPVVGVDMVSDNDARSLIKRFQNGDDTTLAANVTTFIPGDQDIFPFAGVLFNSTQVGQAMATFAKMFDVLSLRDTAEMMVQHGAVATYREYELQSTLTGKKTKLAMCEHFLINWKLQIQQYSFYFDTYPLTLIMQ